MSKAVALGTAALCVCACSGDDRRGADETPLERDGGASGAESGNGGAPSNAGASNRGGKSGSSTSAGGRTGKGGAPAGTGGAKGGGGATNPGDVVTYGQIYSGGEFHEGPVDYDETKFHNACAPATKYAMNIRQAEGTLLAGLWNGIPNTAAYCDACIYVSTAKGKHALLRVVTYGDTSTNSIDVSPEAYAILNSGEYPRSMTWQFAKCDDTGKMVYEFQTGSNEWWTSFWLRNARVPLTKIEVKSANHASFVELARGTDGTLTDGGGFGKGPFSIRATGVDGQVVTDTFDWPASGIAGAVLTGQGNFQ